MAIDSSRRLRSSERVERAHELAAQVLTAVSSHAAAGQTLWDFYGRLARTVRELLVGARRVLFWRLHEESQTLASIPAGGFGIDPAFLDRIARLAAPRRLLA